MKDSSPLNSVQEWVKHLLILGPYLRQWKSGVNIVVSESLQEIERVLYIVEVQVYICWQ